MTIYKAIGPDQAGTYHVGYQINQGICAVVCECPSKQSAEEEAVRLNEMQHKNSASMKQNRKLCGLRD